MNREKHFHPLAALHLLRKTLLVYLLPFTAGEHVRFFGQMILDIEIFKNQGPIKEATLVPLVFPLLAGAGAFTTLLSLRAEYASVNIIIALVLNMIWVYFVVSMTGRVERFLGKGGIYIIRKFFGIILLAISVRLFTANITLLIEALHRS